jgi:hypothetical protein
VIRAPHCVDPFVRVGELAVGVEKMDEHRELLLERLQKRGSLHLAVTKACVRGGVP